ncbi:unnamed protein product [Allacma fusca]|uniref:Uncharacterized protein n=1 Tax=Allacma fusca TaxID=39272 RepID=A0A8J2JH34_9HEXA|nr:unnamed protein product [Allacma fusca]
MEITDYDYFVVMFVKKKEVEAVPRKWIIDEEGKRFCYWPNYPDIEDIYAAARDSDFPNKKTWKKYTIRIMHGFETYKLVVSIIPHFCEHSDFEIPPRSETVLKISGDSGRKVKSSYNGPAAKLPRKEIFKLPSPPESNRRNTQPALIPELHVNSGVEEDSVGIIANQYIFTALGTDPHASDNDEELDLHSMAPKSSQIFNNSAETPSSNYVVSTSNHKLRDVNLEDLKVLVVRNFAIARINHDALTTSIEIKTLVCNRATLPSMPSAIITEPRPNNFGLPLHTVEEFVNLDLKLSQDLKFKQSMVAHLDLTGGKRLVERINSIIRKLMKSVRTLPTLAQLLRSLSAVPKLTLF